MSLLVTEMIKIILILKSHDLSILVLVEWILSASLNIQTLTLDSRLDGRNRFHNEIGCLNNLKELTFLAESSSDLKKVTITASRIMTTLTTLPRRLL